MGLDVYFSISNQDMVRYVIRKGYSLTELSKALDGVHPLNNILRKDCCRHFIKLQWGRLCVGIRRKVPDCVANAFRLEFPSPDGNYMGHRDSYAASALFQERQKGQDFPASALFED
jgi:hypothetical protein